MDDLNLWYGEDFLVSENIIIKNPKIKDIRKTKDNPYGIGFDLYNTYISCIVTTPFDMMLELEESGVNYETITHYQLFWSFYCNDKKYRDALAWFTGMYFDIIENNEDKKIVLVNNTNQCFIDEIIFLEIVNFIRRINFITSEQKWKFGNKTAELYWREQERKKRIKAMKKGRTEKKEKTMASIMSYVYWKSNKSKEELDDLSIYAFWEGYYRLAKIENKTNALIGIYTNVDVKKLNFEEMDDSKVIEVKFETKDVTNLNKGGN